MRLQGFCTMVCWHNDDDNMMVSRKSKEDTSMCGFCSDCARRMYAAVSKPRQSSCVCNHGKLLFRAEFWPISLQGILGNVYLVV